MKISLAFLKCLKAPLANKKRMMMKAAGKKLPRLKFIKEESILLQLTLILPTMPQVHKHSWKQLYEILFRVSFSYLKGIHAIMVSGKRSQLQTPKVA